MVEIGTEELPPKALLKLSQAFRDGIRAGLEKAELGHEGIEAFASPRRLAVRVRHLILTQPDKQVERRGPALNAAFDAEGKPTKAAQGFARSCGTKVEALERLETDKGTWLVWRGTEQGQATAALLPDIVRQALDGLPIPKRMRWGALDAQFVRPVHWAVLLFGEELIETEILAVKTGRETRGHRFHHPEPILIANPTVYEETLAEHGRVIADFDKRRQSVRRQVEDAGARAGGRAVIDPELLDEVTAMVEWPHAVMGRFDERFLDVPAEALISTMKGNQKYFHVVDEAERLLPAFITVSNIDSRDEAAVRAGNERVVRPRLADAEFFWNQDRKHTLAERRESLKGVVFQRKLGTLFDKSRRASELAKTIAVQLGGDGAAAARAAELSKCDLMTEMVGEFPELQGVMGRYYATHDGEAEAVAQAIDEHYRPRFAGDVLPQSATGQALAIADKLDTLLGIFAIGQHPSGDKDPFALRRAALGVLRIVIECRLDLDLRELLQAAANAFPGEVKASEAVTPVVDFMLERLRAYYLERGMGHDVLDAVLAGGPSRPLDIDRRLQAVAGFRARPEAESLAAANKRIGNILRKSGGEAGGHVDPELLREPAEQTLHGQMTEASAAVGPLFETARYEDALAVLARLREPVDAFFDQVLVMDEDPRLRDNRIALLDGLHRLFLRVADISRLQH